MNKKITSHRNKIYDYVVLFSHSSLKMSLTDDGWIANDYLPVEKDKVVEVYNFFFKPQDSWQNTLYSQTGELEFSVYFDEEKPEKIESIVIRISLKPQLSKEKVLNIAQTVVNISKKLELLPFDVYSGKIMNSDDEITASIRNSPKGKMYGYYELFK